MIVLVCINICFSGKNQNYRNGFQQYKEWEKTFAFGEGSSSSEECDLDSDDEKSAIGQYFYLSKRVQFSFYFQ